MTHVTDVHNDKILSNDNEDYESVSPAADVTGKTKVFRVLGLVSSARPRPFPFPCFPVTADYEDLA